MIRHHVEAKNMELTSSIKDYLSKKIEGVEKFLEQGIESVAHVELGRSTHHHHKGDVFMVEINLRSGDHTFRAVIESDDLYKAIDMVREELVGEITRFRKKERHLLKRGKQKIKDMLRGVWRR